jgi:hypothetical protein
MGSQSEVPRLWECVEEVPVEYCRPYPEKKKKDGMALINIPENLQDLTHRHRRG